MENLDEIIIKSLIEENKKSLIGLKTINTKFDILKIYGFTYIAVFNNTISVKSRSGDYLQNAYRMFLFIDTMVVLNNMNVIDIEHQKNVEDAKSYFINKMEYIAKKIKHLKQ